MSGDAKYFQTTKKGEIKELQEDLNSTDRPKVKEAVKKVIAAMTVGKDVSMLFSDVIKSMATDNIELKKLVYLYIINYARSQPEKAILVVNMFRRDATEHPNPLVRALSIRTMGCIRVDRITEYLCDPLGMALKDQDPYVRKTAAICVAKLYDINAELVEERQFIEQLRIMLSDVNPMVVANAVAALTEISEASGTDHFKIDGETLSKLLTALNECTEWGRVFILEALSKFDASQQQAKDICDRVVPQLQHGNSAVVMSAVKVVIRFLSKCRDDDVNKFCKKLAPPLITLLSSQPEIQYVALRNIDLIVQKYPKILHNDIRVFFVKFNDAQYVKMQKLEILIKLTNSHNVESVLAEFKEYAQEVDIEFVRKSVRAIGRVAVKLEKSAGRCVTVLSELVKMRVGYVVQECVIVIKDIFRRYPRKYEKIIIDLTENLESLDEPEAKASMIWIIGEYADRIVDAEERLEHFVMSFDEESSMVQLQLLTATVKLFLKKPDSAKGLVQKVLNLATESTDNPDLRDRGYVYWRLLSSDPAAAKAVVLAERPVISNETFKMPKDYLAALLDNISTLSSVYHRPPSEFVRGVQTVQFKPFEARNNEESSSSGSESSSSEDNRRKNKRGGRGKKSKKTSRKSRKREESSSEEDESDSDDGPAQDTPARPAARQQPPPQAEVQVKKQQEPQQDLLGDLFGGGGGNNNAPANSVQQATGGGGMGLGGGLDDLFGDLGGSSGGGNSSGPSLPSLLSSNDGQGLHLGATFEYNTNTKEYCMMVEVHNTSNEDISRIDLKFNKNYLGIQPKGSMINLNGNLSANGGLQQNIAFPLVLNQPATESKPLNRYVEMAIRNVRPSGAKVAKFRAEIPGHIFFETVNVEKAQFATFWKNLPNDQASFEAMNVNTNVDAVKQKFNSNRCNHIADRAFPGKGVAVYFASKLKNAPILIEATIGLNGQGKVTVKSKDKWLAYVALESVKQWAQ